MLWELNMLDRNRETNPDMPNHGKNNSVESIGIMHIVCQHIRRALKLQYAQTGRALGYRATYQDFCLTLLETMAQTYLNVPAPDHEKTHNRFLPCHLCLS